MNKYIYESKKMNKTGEHYTKDSRCLKMFSPKFCTWNEINIYSGVKKGENKDAECKKLVQATRTDLTWRDNIKNLSIWTLCLQN